MYRYTEAGDTLSKAEERRLTRVQLTALERGVPQPGAGLKPGFGAPKSATLSSASSSAASSSSFTGGGGGGGGVSGDAARGKQGGGANGGSGSSGDASGDALMRADDAIRARASSVGAVQTELK